jgi:hypothetical protein
VAEEFGLQQGLRQRRAIHGDERHVAPRGQVVQSLGGKLLAGARLPFDEHRGRHRGQLLDPHEHLLNGRALAVNTGPLLQPPPADQALGGGEHLRRLHGLGQPAGQSETAHHGLGVGLGFLNQPQRRDGTLLGQGGQIPRTPLVQLAGENDDVGLRALDGRQRVVHRRHQHRLLAVLLEGGVRPDGRLQIIHRQEDRVRHQ